jgi:hypothetical protein
MQKPDADPLPDIDDTQDGVLGASYSTPSVSAPLSSALGENAAKYSAVAFVLLCFLCFGPRGIAMAIIVLGALRLTLRPISMGSGSSSSGSGGSNGILASTLSPSHFYIFVFPWRVLPAQRCLSLLILAAGGGAARGSNIRTLSDLPKSNQGGG